MKTVYIDKSYNFCPHFSHIFYVGGTVTPTQPQNILLTICPLCKICWGKWCRNYGSSQSMTGRGNHKREPTLDTIWTAKTQRLNSPETRRECFNPSQNSYSLNGDGELGRKRLWKTLHRTSNLTENKSIDKEWGWKYPSQGTCNRACSRKLLLGMTQTACTMKITPQAPTFLNFVSASDYFLITMYSLLINPLHFLITI